MSLRCKLYVYDDDGTGGGGGGSPSSWRAVGVGDAALKRGRGGAQFELTARGAGGDATRTGTVCYRHVIKPSPSPGATTIVPGPASNLLCWCAVNEADGDSPTPRRYLAKFETSGHALVFQKEHQRLQHDGGRG